MKGIKPYVNVAGKVFDVYECAAETSCDTKTFERDSVMGVLLLNKRDSRIDELNEILDRVTLYSGKAIPRRTRQSSRQESHRKDGCKTGTPVTTDRDDRLISTYRPFADLACPNKAKKKPRAKSATNNTK